MGPDLSDYNMQLIILSVIQLSGGHCIEYLTSYTKVGYYFSLLNHRLMTYIESFFQYSSFGWR